MCSTTHEQLELQLKVKLTLDCLLFHRYHEMVPEALFAVYGFLNRRLTLSAHEIPAQVHRGQRGTGGNAARQTLAVLRAETTASQPERLDGCAGPERLADGLATALNVVIAEVHLRSTRTAVTGYNTP